MSDESSEVDEIRHVALGLAYVLVVGLWLVGTAVVDVAALWVWWDGPSEVLDDLIRRPGHELEDLAEDVVAFVCFPLSWPFYAVSLFITSRLLEPLLQEIRNAMVPVTPTSDADLSKLSPGLRGLIVDARALCVALETRDEATLREVWDWQRRFEGLGDADRRELEHLGLGNPGIAERLLWAVEKPTRTERGIREIVTAFEQFEERLLAPSSVFRGPFR